MSINENKLPKAVYVRQLSPIELVNFANVQPLTQVTSNQFQSSHITTYLQGRVVTKMTVSPVKATVEARIYSDNWDFIQSVGKDLVSKGYNEDTARSFRAFRAGVM